MTDEVSIKKIDISGTIIKEVEKPQKITSTYVVKAGKTETLELENKTEKDIQVDVKIVTRDYISVYGEEVIK